MKIISVFAVFAVFHRPLWGVYFTVWKRIL